MVFDCFLLKEKKVTEREGKKNFGYRDFKIILQLDDNLRA